ncbi:MAG: hypothetical protein SGBAC_006376 [Bacillariaceae sp.]
MAKASVGAQTKATKILAVGLSVSCFVFYLVSSGRKNRRRRRRKAETSSNDKNKLRVEELLAEINQIDIHKIELRPHALKYIQTIDAHLKCFDQLAELYNEVDPSHKLANYDMPDAEHPIQQLSTTSDDPVKNLDELYEVAEAMLPVFTAKIESLLAQGNNSEEESSGMEFKLPPWQHKLKRRQRASEKAEDDYSEKRPGPPESWLNDIVRGSVVFNDADQLLLFLELVCGDESIEIVKSKNRFRNPTIAGYRDWHLQIQISTEDGNMKHTCELQLHLDTIKEAGGRLGSYDYYEFFRLYHVGTNTLEERMDDLRIICDGGSLNTTTLGNIMKNPLESSRMLRLADLFGLHMNEYQLALVITNATRTSLEPRDWYTRMGNLFWQQGKPEDAMGMYERALAIRMSALRPDHVDTAEAYTNMADALANQGRLVEAMGLYQTALDIELKTLGPDHADVAATYNKMAKLLSNQGKLDEALATHQKALDIQLDALGPDHPYTAHTYASMANVLQNQGNLDEALTFYQMAMVIFFKVRGPDHADTVHTYANMATVLNQKGNLSSQTGTPEESPRRRRRKKLSSKKPMFSLAAIRGDPDPVLEEKQVDEPPGAIKKEKQSPTPKKCPAKKSRRRRRKVSSLKAISEDSEDDISEGSSVGEFNLTPPLHSVSESPTLPPPLNLENMEGGGSADSKTDEGISESISPVSPPAESFNRNVPDEPEEPETADTATSYISRAVVLQNQGKLEEAMALYQKALDIRLKVLGPDHEGTAGAYVGLANVEHDQGRPEEAMVLFQKALDIRCKVLEPEHEDMANTYYDMAHVLQDQNKLIEALSMKQKALDIRLKVLGPDHATTADTYSSIGDTLCKQGKLDDALVACQKALDIQLSSSDAEDHASTGVTFHTTAEILFNQGQLVEAMALCQHALAIFWRTLGPGHPSTAKAKELMEVAQHMMTEKCVKRKRKEILGWTNQAN